MKKFICVTLALGMFAGIAMASSLAVPAWRDVEANGWRGFITLKNNTNSPVTLEVRYFEPQGAEQTPAANTFVLNGQNSVNWRPATNDPGAEGAGNGIGDATNRGNGSATISWTGGPNDIQGKYFEEIFVDGASYGYLLPPGL